ncbi:hypothetical protein RJT34_29791 [Clitoria ternatea]|uniref:Uncharacterized protein n=1 Tax=Clitoria ternatea TaxID=43366 RepID=A0AAN9ES61_CLITE
MQGRSEGSSESEDPAFGTEQTNSRGINSMGVGNIDLNLGYQPSQTVKNSEKVKKDSGSMINESMNQMAETLSSHVSVIVSKSNNEAASVDFALEMLHKFPEYADKTFFAKCVRVLRDKDVRLWFTRIKAVTPLISLFLI